MRANLIFHGAVASECDKKWWENFFTCGPVTQNPIFAESQGVRAGDSYPLFLWITLCIRVRKRVQSERARGLGMN
ncbi:hypothetical protein C3369_08990 [Escherichia sp. ESNIH1]|nr:hypothetical protein C3369_08990 [Escherichia sp. ESNIH1]